MNDRHLDWGKRPAERDFLQSLQSLSDEERQLLAVIGGEGRISNARLARRLGAPPSSTFNRLTGLITRRVITGFHTLIDRRATGLLLEVLVGVELHDQDTEKVRQVVAAARRLPNVSAVMRTSGRFDLYVQAVVPSTEELLPLVIEPLSAVGAVRRTDTALVAEHWRRPGLLSPFVRH